MLVTGATDGLGRATALALAGSGVTLHLHGRDPGKLERVRDEVARETRETAPVVHLADLASLAEVRQLAASVEERTQRLDVLVNNAGVGPSVGRRERLESADGHELHLAVNYLAPFLLTLRLLPLLRRSAPARVVNVVSSSQAPLDLDDLELARDYDARRAYARSKLAGVLFTFELAERLRAGGIGELTANALHPATRMRTKLARIPFWRRGSSVEEGVTALVRLVLDPSLAGVSGRYFERGTDAVPHRQAYDPVCRRLLWERSEALAGERFFRSGDG